MTRKISQAGIDLIKSFEGCRLSAYNATGKEQYLTIGWGHYGPDVKPGMTITQAEADEMFLKDIQRYVEPVNALNLQLNQNQFDALVSFCYNCGAGNLRGLCLGRTITQIAENLPKYNKGGGVVLAGLTRRRSAELELFNKEGEDEMKPEDKAAFDALAARVAELEGKQSMPCPEWAKQAVDAAVEAKLIDTPNGRSYDFYSLVTVLHRKGAI